MTVRRSTTSATSVQNNVGYTEKNIRTDLKAMREMVSMNSQSTPTIDSEVVKASDKERISEKLGL